MSIETQHALFKDPYVDRDEWRNQPALHRYVHGGFAGTETRFSFYFPPEAQYEGRFFQYITPSSTAYWVVDGQVQIPPTADVRKGIQPVVRLTANGGERAEIAAGAVVEFNATIEVPPGSGTVVSVEWDFEGTGDYPLKEQFGIGENAESATQLTLRRTYSFATPGTYLPVVRAVSQRQGNAHTPFTRIQNLSRVRVVVR